MTEHPPPQPPQLLPAPLEISPSLTVQAPLSRRGHGPGLVLVVDHYAALAEGESLDPPPLQKWAEEGFAVAQIKVPGKVEDGGEFPLDRAIDALRGLEACTGVDEKGVGLVSYLSRLPFYVEEAACISPHIKAVISYGGKKFTSLSSTSSLPPQLLHIPGPKIPRRESFSVVPDFESAQSSSSSPEGIVKTYQYISAKPDSGWALPADEAYDGNSAALAHSRSLAFLKPLLGGPYFDLEAVWEEHCRFEFLERNVERTMETMVQRPYVNHIPTMTGGIGKERLTTFYTTHFIFSNPPDTSLDLVSRTVGADRVVDEFVFKMTHDRVVEWILPSIPPTNRSLSIPFVSVVTLRGDRLAHEHIHWDQGTVLRQLGLLPEWTAFPYPIDGKETEQGKKYEIRVPVAGKETAKKLVNEGSVESNLLIGKEWKVVDG